VSVSPRNKNAK